MYVKRRKEKEKRRKEKRREAAVWGRAGRGAVR